MFFFFALFFFYRSLTAELPLKFNVSSSGLQSCSASCGLEPLKISADVTEMNAVTTSLAPLTSRKTTNQKKKEQQVVINVDPLCRSAASPPPLRSECSASQSRLLSVVQACGRAGAPLQASSPTLHMLNGSETRSSALGPPAGTLTSSSEMSRQK